MSSLVGTGKKDVLTGGKDDDVILGAGGKDTLTGGGGNDTMWGGGGNDLMSGGDGDDVMVGSNKGASKTNLSNLKISEDVHAKITFDGESAGYKNTLGMYKIGADGKISDVKIVFANASLKGSGGDLVGGVSSKDFDLKAGEKIGFFIVPNAYDQSYDKGRIPASTYLNDPKATWKLVDMDSTKGGKVGVDGNVEKFHTKLVYVGADGKEVDIKSQYGNEVFHNSNKSGWLNADGFNHVKGEGDALDGKIKIGFEDLINGGDKDFDDVSFTLDIGANNVTSLTTGSGKVAKHADNDDMSGGSGNDKMYGVSGDDKMDGGTGNDKMSGGSGNDVMTGGEGDDLIMGNAGNDRILADAGNDRIYGGSGFDTLDFSGWSNGVKVDLKAHVAYGAGKDYVNGIEAVTGTKFDDVLGGDKGANALNGGDGHDVLRGRGGEDKLTGGAGDDTFVWYAKDMVDAKGNSLGVDHVTDFAKGDVLDLHFMFKGMEGKPSDMVSVTDAKDGLHISAKINGKFVDVAVLDGVHGMTTADMLAHGALLV